MTGETSTSPHTWPAWASAITRSGAIAAVTLPRDKRFGIGNFEDDDYCRRAGKARYKLAIACDSFVSHFGGATFRATGINFAALMQHNEKLYREKWHDPSADSGGVAVAASAFTSAFTCQRPSPLRGPLNEK